MLVQKDTKLQVGTNVWIQTHKRLLAIWQSMVYSKRQAPEGNDITRQGWFQAAEVR